MFFCGLLFEIYRDDLNNIQFFGVSNLQELTDKDKVREFVQSCLVPASQLTLHGGDGR